MQIKYPHRPPGKHVTLKAGSSVCCPPPEPMLPTHIDAAHDWLLTRLAHPLAERPGDVPHRQPNLTRPAAVLIPLVWRPESPGIVLTRRESGLRHHAGQLSFPG